MCIRDRKYIEDPLAEFILNESPAEGAEFKAVINKSKDALIIKSSTAIEPEDVK